MRKKEAVNEAANEAPSMLLLLIALLPFAEKHTPP